jgi:hypothetical protein
LGGFATCFSQMAHFPVEYSARGAMRGGHPTLLVLHTGGMQLTSHPAANFASCN